MWSARAAAAAARCRSRAGWPRCASGGCWVAAPGTMRLPKPCCKLGSLAGAVRWMRRLGGLVPLHLHGHSWLPLSCLPLIAHLLAFLCWLQDHPRAAELVFTRQQWQRQRRERPARWQRCGCAALGSGPAARALAWLHAAALYRAARCDFSVASLSACAQPGVPSSCLPPRPGTPPAAVPPFQSIGRAPRGRPESPRRSKVVRGGGFGACCCLQGFVAAGWAGNPTPAAAWKRLPGN